MAAARAAVLLVTRQHARPIQKYWSDGIRMSTDNTAAQAHCGEILMGRLRGAARLNEQERNEGSQQTPRHTSGSENRQS